MNYYCRVLRLETSQHQSHPLRKDWIMIYVTARNIDSIHQKILQYFTMYTQISIMTHTEHLYHQYHLLHTDKRLAHITIYFKYYIRIM
ncbi:hypothetical protein GDO78_001729 [Eleutherodactylus coqui]|uniref:Uncharacterized protein n=1 Tax=Eleutherodactylus coqui TaxID=57060 RepID=A0A8J6FTU7_ELECQ|nr:hypothetical protein GDO78_001729 [Eleutherodactylus coqui]